ncbi:MAG: site-2 protease family protein, partial [Planctomycetota bacterium]
MSSYGPYDNSPLGRFLQLVMRTFAIGTFFGVHVRMYWAAAILMPLFFWQGIGAVAGSGLESLVLVAICFCGLFVVIWTHEMGHIAAGWRHGIRTDLITLSPLGGVAHMGAPARTPREEMIISLAGPAVHLVWLAVFWPLLLLLPDRVFAISGFRFCPLEFAVWYLVTVNKSLLLFNLLPFFPLDGGHVLRAVLSLRVHPNRATLWATSIGMAGAAVLIGLSLWQPRLQSTIGLVLAISCIQACLNERRVAQHVLIYQHYQQAARQPWEVDPDAWRHGGDPRERRLPKPGAFARWRAARAA